MKRIFVCILSILSVFAAMTVASLARPSDLEVQRFRAEAAAGFRAAFDVFRDQSRERVAKLREQQGASIERNLRACADPERTGPFAGQAAPTEEKLASLDAAVEHWRNFLSGRGNASQIVASCVEMAMATDHLWAGVIWARLIYHASRGDRGGDLLASYFGSGVLGFTDLVLARRYLEGGSAVAAHIDRDRLLARLDQADGTAHVQALFEEKLAEVSQRISPDSLLPFAGQIGGASVQELLEEDGYRQTCRRGEGGTDISGTPLSRQPGESELQFIERIADSHTISHMAEMSDGSVRQTISIYEFCHYASIYRQKYRNALVFAVMMSEMSDLLGSMILLEGIEGIDTDSLRHMTQAYSYIAALLIGSGRVPEVHDLAAAAAKLETSVAVSQGDPISERISANADLLLREARALPW